MSLAGSKWCRHVAALCTLLPPIQITWAEIALRTGKSTLLQILAGKHMVGPDAVLVLGRSAFHDVVRLFSAIAAFNMADTVLGHAL